VLAFASIATVINALIRLCCFILLIPSWKGKMPIPERSKNSRGIRYPRGVERECLTWRCRIEKAGDTFRVTAGCDRTHATCRAKFRNAVNFRGFPHMPGNDFIIRMPQQGEPGLDGGSFFGDASLIWADTSVKCWSQVLP
jgi:hypothetical protein